MWKMFTWLRSHCIYSLLCLPGKQSFSRMGAKSHELEIKHTNQSNQGNDKEQLMY